MERLHNTGLDSLYKDWTFNHKYRYRYNYIYIFFFLWVGFPLYPEIFYFITPGSCSASGSLWEMLDPNPGPSSLVRYQWATTTCCRRPLRLVANYAGLAFLTVFGVDLQVVRHRWTEYFSLSWPSKQIWLEKSMTPIGSTDSKETVETNIKVGMSTSWSVLSRMTL